MRESVVKEWQRSQARPKAQSRAKGLVEIALKSPEKLLEESLAQETLSGEKDGLNVTSADLFHKTGEFSWLQGSVVPHTGMDRQTPPPTRFTIPGLTDAGDEFMQTVFDELKPGGVGVASNIERTVYYVVRITKRDPSDAAALEKFRKDFLETGTSAQRRPEYGHLYRGKLQEYLSGWQEQLMKKHGATLRQHDANAKRAAEPVYDEGEY